MRKTILVSVLFAMMTAAVAAKATPVTVNFGALGSDSANITAPDSYTLDGITFRYDDFGSGVDFAQVDSNGVFGSTNGLLIFDFSAPTNALSFDFSLLGLNEPLDVNDSMFVSLKSGGITVAESSLFAFFAAYDPGDPSMGGDAFGSFSFGGKPFDQALMVFSTDAPFFSVANVSHVPSTTAVPEPSSLALAALGLLGLPCKTYLMRKR